MVASIARKRQVRGSSNPDQDSLFGTHLFGHVHIAEPRQSPTAPPAMAASSSASLHLPSFASMDCRITSNDGSHFQEVSCINNCSHGCLVTKREIFSHIYTLTNYRYSDSCTSGDAELH